MLSLPLKPISIEAHFQQWGLDFIGEINHTSSSQHKWILTETNYFTKWIESIPSKKCIESMIIEFLLNNIMSKFGCPRNLITNNAQAFKSHKMISFFNKYNIILSHSTAYYPQGNVLAESSNKSLIRIIKKLLQENKRSWHTKLKYALWVDTVSTKRVIGMSPFQLVYGTNVIFPDSLGLPVNKFL